MRATLGWSALAAQPQGRGAPEKEAAAQTAALTGLYQLAQERVSRADLGLVEAHGLLSTLASAEMEKERRLQDLHPALEQAPGMLRCLDGVDDQNDGDDVVEGRSEDVPRSQAGADQHQRGHDDASQFARVYG